MVKKRLSKTQKIKKLGWLELLGNPLRVILYPIIGYLITLPVDKWGVELSQEQYAIAIIVLSALQSLLYNGAKAYKQV